MKINTFIDKLKFDEVKPGDLGDIDLEPGDILKLKNGEYELVGDINPRLGTCDCCSSDRSDYIAISKDAFSQILVQEG